jgi:hypothetical protein
MSNVIPITRRARMTTRSGKIRTTLDVKGVTFDGTLPAALIKSNHEQDLAQARDLVTRQFIERGQGTVYDLARLHQHAEAMVKRGEKPGLAAWMALNFQRLTGQPS